jgi:hypothetical protein
MINKKQIYISFLICTLIISNCITLIGRNFYFNKKETDASYDACIYYSKGENFPRSSDSFNYALVTDFFIGLGLGIVKPVYGIIYFALGYPQIGAESFPPYTFDIWCGEPENSTQPPYEYYFILDFEKVNSRKTGEADYKSCLLNESRKNRILEEFITTNFTSICKEGNCKDIFKNEYDLSIKYANYFENIGNLVLNEERNGYCVYYYYLKGGRDSMENIFKNKDNIIF